jgi:Holliday junction resolvase RusA-like endonuclease
MTIAFTVLGVPQTAGSKRAFPFKRANGKLGVAVSDMNPKGKDWKASIAQAAREAYDGELLTGPLAVEMRFYMPRPKGHFGAKGLLPRAPKEHTKAPDCLKLSRCAEDALNKILWHDDSQIVCEMLEKFYINDGKPARMEMKITPLAE